MYLFSAMLTARTTLTGIKNKYYLKSDRRLLNFFFFSGENIKHKPNRGRYCPKRIFR